jgi:hypothetical protein
VNIYFRLTDYVEQISSDYSEGSCAYNATLRHEMEEHVVNPVRVMYRFRDPLIAALNALPLPTANAPRFVSPAQAQAVESEFIRRVGRIVQDFRNRVSTALKQARVASDSAANYQLVYRQCPVEEWNRP